MTASQQATQCLGPGHAVLATPWAIAGRAAALLKDGPAQFERLVLVELALVEEDAKVLQQWGRLTGRGRHLLKLGDRLGRSKNPLGRVGGNLEKEKKTNKK